MLNGCLLFLKRQEISAYGACGRNARHFGRAAALGIGYTGGTSLLLASVLTVLGLWYWSERTVSVNTVNTPKVEAFYWATITLSQTLGTALGDWMADDTGLGYVGRAAVFCVGLALSGAAYFWTKFSGWPYFGRHLSSPGRWARPLATSSTSLMTMAALLSAALSRRWLSWPLWF